MAKTTELATARDRLWRLNVQDFAERVSGGRWVCYSWLDAMLARVVDRILEGNARIIINAPPRHGKSEALSHWLPAWFLNWNPDRNVILASYSDTYAAKWGLAVRDELTQGKDTWTRVRPDKSVVSDWQTTQGGGMRSVGVGGSITGHGGNLIIVDDPHKDWEEAMSQSARDKINDWIEGTIAPRLEPNGSIVMAQTRWHEDDQTGRLLKKRDEAWELLRFPALSEGDGDLLGRPEGEALCPERYPREVLEGIRAARGSFRFAGLYQQRPSPIKGGIVKRDWFGRWQPGDLPADAQWIISIDPTQKSKGTSYFVAQVWAYKEPRFYLVDQFRDRISFLESIKLILRLKAQFPRVEDVVVEESANGPAIIDTLKAEVPGIQAKRVTTSKENRLIAVSGMIESGRVMLPSDADWVAGFVDELATFPNSVASDQVDGLTLALDWLSAKKTATFNFQISLAGARASPWKEIHG
jgi:predicted phage terminase large subunit-like protein